MNKFVKMLKSESGATAIEYGLIAAFIALAIYVGAQVAGNGLDTMFTAVGERMEEAAQTMNN